MCGVLGFRSENERKDLGAVSSKLLRMLEYRGYDSTGAAIQNSKGEIFLRKDVGAPSVVTVKLNIPELAGKIFCGQVRWATFGSVTKENAQPHEVNCKTHIYGAHNGNITNCDQLKHWLTDLGHKVVSDNDGEMLVHCVEHFFAIELNKGDKKDHKFRYDALKKAVIDANQKVTGSFAAVIVDPITENMVAIKAGSSLYLGQGHDVVGGSFIVVSSDLASVLSQTKILIPINENEFCMFNDKEYTFYNINTGENLKRDAVRSKLKIEETKLNEPFKYFMEQEIFNQVESSQRVITLYAEHCNNVDIIEKLEKKDAAAVEHIKDAAVKLSSSTDWDAFEVESKKLLSSSYVTTVKEDLKTFGVKLDRPMESSLSSFLEEIGNQKSLASYKDELKVIDFIFGADETRDAKDRVKNFVEIVSKAHSSGKAIYCIACGTSYNAAKSAAIFFNYIAGIGISPMLPGDFRSQASNAVNNGDIIIGISQSGETKDLIDIINQIKESGKKVTNIIIVNNVNSTLALEKSDLYLPLYCGSEIAVPATKSFINELVVLYILAIGVAEKLGRDVKVARDNLRKIPQLIANTIENTKKSVESVGTELFLEPSIHILATGMQGIAREGSLKIREVVLNHTEGYEATEFKHGPNTILGVNTVFGIDAVRALLKKFSDIINDTLDSEYGKKIDSKSLHKLYNAVADYAFMDTQPKNLNENELSVFKNIFDNHNFFNTLYTNYPLLFITGPNDRDVNLTVSQINTHKIRGANIYVIAEENSLLHDACSKPVQNKYGANYRYGYIKLPATGDNILPFFSSAVVLQLLALNMSIKKLTFLDKLEIEDHGVHPDSPKNVSKSITVD